MKMFSSILSPTGNLTAHSSQLTLTIIGKIPIKFICIMTVLTLFITLQSKAQFTSTYSGSGTTTDTIATVSGVTHISCDGIVDDLFSPTDSFKVFAWDGPNAAWGYDYNGSKVNMNYFLTSNVNEPEIALVSDSAYNYIYALLIYIDGNDSAVYECYKWGSGVFPATPTVTGTLALSASTGETSIAGDKYNHFVMVCDQGNNASGDLYQLTGYIDPGSGNLVFGSIGKVNYSGKNIFQPDIDITYDEDARPDYKAVVALSFTYDTDDGIVSNSTDLYSLFTGATWNASTGNDVLTTASGGRSVNHSCVSLNDGCFAYLSSSTSTPQGAYPIHYGVAYHDFDGTTDSYIQQYPVTLPNGWGLFPFSVGAVENGFSTQNENNSIYSENNNFPDIIVQPQEVNTIVAWNFVRLINTLFTTPECLSNQFDYPFDINVSSTWTDPCNVGTQEMLLNVNTGQTTELAISTFSELDLLYFYYDDNTNDLLYKTRPFSNSQLREGKSNLSKLPDFYPNPFEEHLVFRNLIEEENYQIEILSMSGFSHFNADLLGSLIETKLNSIIPKYSPGVYLLKVVNKEGAITIKKLIKQ